MSERNDGIQRHIFGVFIVLKRLFSFRLYTTKLDSNFTVFASDFFVSGAPVISSFNGVNEKAPVFNSSISRVKLKVCLNYYRNR